MRFAGYAVVLPPAKEAHKRSCGRLHNHAKRLIRIDLEPVERFPIDTSIICASIWIEILNPRYSKPMAS